MQSRVWDTRDNIEQKGGAGAGMVNSPEMILKPGYPISSYYGYKFLGIWQQDQAAEAALYGNAPGDYHYEDFNGDSAINGVTSRSSDQESQLR